jgi:hypothetical protein
MICWRVIKCAAAALAIPTIAVADSLLDKLLRVAGLTSASAPGHMRTDKRLGSIWIANLELGNVIRLTIDSGYRSPVFSPTGGSIFALKGDTVVRIPSDGGAPTAIQRVTGAMKLVGFDGKSPNEIVIFLEGGSSPLAVLSLENGNVTPLPYDANSVDQQRMLGQILGEDRVYGTARVYLNPERKQGLSRDIEWTDVYLQRGDSTPENVSRCNGVSCMEPALSPDGRRVVFVKSGN